MKPERLIALTLLGVLTAASGAALAETREDFARVRQVTPQYEQVNLPRQQCVSEYVPPERGYGRSYGGAVIGGITGAIVGNQLGRGHGKEVATAAGAIAGALVGDRLQNRADEGDRAGREVRRCRTRDHWERRLAGYRVVYDYAGRRYSALLPYDPGDRLRVRVSVEPY